VETVLAIALLLSLGTIFWAICEHVARMDLAKEVASLNQNVQWLRQAELARGTNPLTRSQMSDLTASDAFSNWIYAKVEGDVKKAMTGLEPPYKENAPVSNCSAKERITEMRLKALETGQPIDTMDLVRDAYNTMVEAIHPSMTDSTYKREYEQVRQQRDTARALLLFAIERATPPAPVGDVRIERI
jgi:hypothetical protein